MSYDVFLLGLYLFLCCVFFIAKPIGGFGINPFRLQYLQSRRYDLVIFCNIWLLACYVDFTISVLEYSPRFWTAFWESFDSPKLWIFESELFSHGVFESSFIWNFPKRKNNLIFSYFIRNDFLEKPMTENTIFWKIEHFWKIRKTKSFRKGVDCAGGMRRRSRTTRGW